jgi:ABC-type transport system involved in multi-copper enzyme maturation permease subunit
MTTRAAAPALLSYRPWRGTLLGPAHGVWAIARVSFLMLVRRKLFWALYGFSAMIFLFFFYGQYLQFWIGTQLGEQNLRLGSGLVGIQVKPEELLKILQTALHLDGTGYTYRNFFSFESQIVIIVLALAGSILIGNDFRFGSLPFYLSKPLHRWHYLLGKFLGVAIFVNLLTTLPAGLLFLEYGMIDTWQYYIDRLDLLIGILGYGTILSVVLGLTLLATATWVRRTVPMIMVWSGLFLFTRILADILVYRLRLNPAWRLIDLWHDMYLAGNWCLQMPHYTIRPYNQPEYWQAGLALIAVCAGCIVYLNRRIHAVEVVA